eukprot:2749755-Rhodomonas_salina.1
MLECACWSVHAGVCMLECAGSVCVCCAALAVGVWSNAHRCSTAPPLWVAECAWLAIAWLQCLRSLLESGALIDAVWVLGWV